MNIAFYYTNKGTAGQDVRNVLDGNPGIGGTYYAMLLLSKLLSLKSYRNKRFFLFAECTENMPDGINLVKVPSLFYLSSMLEKYEIDILVVNKIGKNTLDRVFFQAIKSNNVKVVIWAHCFIPYFELLRYANNPKVARIVAVGKEQLLTWCDHSAYKKSSYIYNICKYPVQNNMPFPQRLNDVVYVGSIVPLKGLHHLTDAWPYVLKEVPDANLYVIGGGNLYDKSAKLGKFGIADLFYEKRLLKHILTPTGKIHPSVHFLGVMGNEKYRILNKAKVGVPNPGGLTETFGFTAVEMLLSGELVTTIKCPGYLDTVKDSDSILYKTTKDLSKAVVKLLQQKEHTSTDGIDNIHKQFNEDVIIKEWLKLFDEVNTCQHFYHPELSSDYRPTQYKIINKKLQRYLPLLPSLMLYEESFEHIKYIFEKLLDFPTTIQKLYVRKLK